MPLLLTSTILELQQKAAGWQGSCRSRSNSCLAVQLLQQCLRGIYKGLHVFTLLCSLIDPNIQLIDEFLQRIGIQHVLQSLSPRTISTWRTSSSSGSRATVAVVTLWGLLKRLGIMYRSGTDPHRGGRIYSRCMSYYLNIRRID